MLSSFDYKLLSPNFTLGKGKKLFQESERKIINHAFFSSSTQSEIIEKTKISQQTTSRLVKTLFEQGVLHQTSKTSSGGRGQPGYHLKTSADFAYGIGIAILTDSLVISVMDFSGEIIYDKTMPLLNMTVKNVMLHLTTLFDEIFINTNIQKEKVLGIGVGISGYFTTEKDKINTHNRLEEWADVNISKILTDKFNLPVWVDNDATVAAAGEGILGIGKYCNNFVYLFISVDFGGGIIIDGDIMHGTHGNAGEVGDILPPKIYVYPNLENLRQILINNGVNISTHADLMTSFDINWPGIQEWITKVKDAVSLVASSSAALLDTQAIVIGGHIPKSLSKLLIKEVVMYALHRRSSERPKPELLISEVTYEPVSVGAASLPFRALCL
tara:strand:- start:2802 stop:3956 length:1155 start_codon:yes stop_codon:yes gene_type:complete